jgi:exopolysaccharide biosynthesis polyprenyl glycosylphosphotransferase
MNSNRSPHDDFSVGTELSKKEPLPFYNQQQFLHLLKVERKRSERSRRPFLLLLVDLSTITAENNPNSIEKVKTIIGSCLRETDIGGWYAPARVLGIVFTEVPNINRVIIEAILRKIRHRFQNANCEALHQQLKLSSHIFPEESATPTEDGVFNDSLYPDLVQRDLKKKIQIFIKAVFDFSASLLAVLCLSPVFLTIAIIIKATSKGPVFFKQERLGFNGRTFMVLKFRSMYTDCDSKNHKDYIEKFISEKNEASSADGSATFKLTNDSRITPFGQFIRKTSLDELPQFINVLKGDMSLVGPRPPIPYEYDLYDIWHRRRLLSCKPGITGLWQVAGRSRTSFDDMVRLDLKYINEWSLWFDLKILLKTPAAVIMGKGAY